jgi:hypothetical protein
MPSQRGWRGGRGFEPSNSRLAAALLCVDSHHLSQPAPPAAPSLRWIDVYVRTPNRIRSCSWRSRILRNSRRSPCSVAYDLGIIRRESPQQPRSNRDADDDHSAEPTQRALSADRCCRESMTESEPPACGADIAGAQGCRARASGVSKCTWLIRRACDQHALRSL